MAVKVAVLCASVTQMMVVVTAHSCWAVAGSLRGNPEASAAVSQSLHSYNTLCHFYEGTAASDITCYIAQVVRFVKVTPAAIIHLSLRLAITHLFNTERVSGVNGTLYHYAAYPARDGHACTPACTNYAVDLHHSEEGVGMTQD